MTNWDLYNLLNFVARKDNRGRSVTIDEFGRLLQQENLAYFNQMVNVYELNQNVSDSFEPFETSATGTELFNTSYLDLPSDYGYYIDMYYEDDSVKVFDLVLDDEWSMRLGSSLTFPTLSYPMCKIVDDKIYVYPEFGSGTSNIDHTNVVLYYIKKPDTPTVNYTVDDNGNYAYADSVELEWHDQDKLKILARILRSLGIRIANISLFNYAQEMLSS